MDESEVIIELSWKRTQANSSIMRGVTYWRAHQSPVRRPKTADLVKELGIWGSLKLSVLPEL